MKRATASSVLWLAFFAAICACAATEPQAQTVPDGDYIGLEAMPDLTPEEPRTKWFHENKLIIRNGEAILDKVPVTFQNGHKGEGGCDGGCFTYRGRFTSKDGQIFIALRLFESSGLVFPRGPKPDLYTEIKTYPARISPAVIEFAGVKYKHARFNEPVLHHFLDLLNKQPLEQP